MGLYHYALSMKSDQRTVPVIFVNGGDFIFVNAKNISNGFIVDVMLNVGQE